MCLVDLVTKENRWCGFDIKYSDRSVRVCFFVRFTFFLFYMPSRLVVWSLVYPFFSQTRLAEHTLAHTHTSLSLSLLPFDMTLSLFFLHYNYYYTITMVLVVKKRWKQTVKNDYMAYMAVVVLLSNSGPREEEERKKERKRQILVSPEE